MRKDYSKLLWGLIILAVGVIFTGNVMNIWYIDVFFPGWWTLFLIVPGLISIINNGVKWGSAILVLVGMILLFDCLGIFSFIDMWSLVLPLCIVALGIYLIVLFFRGDTQVEKVGIDLEYEYDDKTYNKEDTHSKHYRCDNSEYANYSNVFGSADIKNTSSNLKGIKLESIFGGTTLDLREAKFNDVVTLEVSNIFAGVDIYVPDDVRVETVSSTPILGSLSFRKNKDNPGMPVLKVKYVAIFGGIDIK